VTYDYDALRRTVTRESIQGPHSIWRYRPFYPSPLTRQLMGTGMTLVRANRLGRRLGLKSFTSRTMPSICPPLSFKDRVVSVALPGRRSWDFQQCLARVRVIWQFTAAIAAHAGLDCVFIPADLEAGKVLGTLIYNPTVMAAGNYDSVTVRLPIPTDGFVNINLRPYYSEGSKHSVMK